MVKQVSAVFHGFSSYNTSRVGSPRRATCQNELVTKPGFTNYESVRFFGGRAFASCERRWNTTSPLDQLRASATRLSLIERYLRSRSRLNRDPRDSSWLGVSRPAAIGSCPPPWPFRSTGSSLSIRTCAFESPSDAAPNPANPALPLCVPERPTGGRIAPPLPDPTWPWHSALALARTKSLPSSARAAWAKSQCASEHPQEHAPTVRTRARDTGRSGMSGD